MLITSSIAAATRTPIQPATQQWCSGGSCYQDTNRLAADSPSRMTLAKPEVSANFYFTDNDAYALAKSGETSGLILGLGTGMLGAVGIAFGSRFSQIRPLPSLPSAFRSPFSTRRKFRSSSNGLRW